MAEQQGSVISGGRGPTVTLDAIGFWSYARSDDDASGNALTELRMALKRELMQQLGRDVALFQDVAAIPWGSEWELEIKRAIDRSSFFIPIITPRFIQSTECAKEMWLFVERQKAIRATYPDLPQDSLIFPILYVDIEGIEPIDPEVFAEIKKRQFLDFTEFRFDDITSGKVKRWIANIAGELCRVLRHKLARPLSAEELAAAAAAKAAAAQAQADAKQRAKEKAALIARHARDSEQLAAASIQLDRAFAYAKARVAWQQQDEERAAAAAAAAEAQAEAEAESELAARDAPAGDTADEAETESPAEPAITGQRPPILLRYRNWFIGGAAALVGVIGLATLGPGSQDGPDGSNVSGSDPVAMPTPAASASPAAAPTPRFAAEPWITAHSWAVYGHCDEAVTFSIDGNDLVISGVDTRESYAIDADRSNARRLVTKEQTLVRASDDRMTILYPDSQVELVKCATRR